MRSYISERLLNNTAHVLISGAERMIDPDEVTHALYKEKTVRWELAPYGKRENSRLQNYASWQERLRQDPEVLDFAPRLSTQAILSNGSFTESVNLIGTVPDRQIKITTIESYIREGSFRALNGGVASIVIGSGVAKDLGARIGTYINVSSGNSNTKPFKGVGISH